MARKKNNKELIQKTMYFKPDDEYQAEYIELLNKVGHMQAFVTGLMSHLFIQMNNIDLDNMSKDELRDELKFIDAMYKRGMIPSNTNSTGFITKENTNDKTTTKKEEMLPDEEKEELNAALELFAQSAL